MNIEQGQALTDLRASMSPEAWQGLIAAAERFVFVADQPKDTVFLATDDKERIIALRSNGETVEFQSQFQ